MIKGRVEGERRIKLIDDVKLIEGCKRTKEKG